MPGIYPLLFRTLISRRDPEAAHGMAVRWLSLASHLPPALEALRRLRPRPDPRLRVSAFGLAFENPLGAAAGLDKEGQAVPALWALGFGHVEVGTVTPRAQPGNPRPRVWRLVEQRAVVNALGFPSQGAEKVAERCRGLKRRGVLGVNLGKNRDTPLEQAGEDYAVLVERFAELADYLTINVSSPNTPGLRSLQLGEQLGRLLERARHQAERVAARTGSRPRPLLVKVSPDLTNAELEAVAEVARGAGAAGIVATNTTTSREGLGAEAAALPGGLSGPPLAARATEAVRVLYRRLDGALPIVAAGGVGTAEELVRRVRAGASLVQLYTAMIYEGPGLAARLLRDLSAIADREGWSSIGELVGRDA